MLTNEIVDFLTGGIITKRLTSTDQFTASAKNYNETLKLFQMEHFPRDQQYLTLHTYVCDAGI